MTVFMPASISETKLIVSLKLCELRRPMSRLIAALAVTFALLPVAAAHAPYLVPSEPTNATPHPTLTVVFSDTLKPDAKIPPTTWTKLDGLTLSATGADGTVTPLVLTPGEHCRRSPLPADARVVRGSVVYGVFQKGDEPAGLLTYYPKAVLGPIATESAVESEGVDIAPVRTGDQLRFRVTDNGKPVSQLEVTLFTEATGQSQKLMTDESGRTPKVTANGRVAITARIETAAAGGYAGRKFTKWVRVATLVVGQASGQ